MYNNPNGFNAMSVFTRNGERKYLTAKERSRFYDCLKVLDNPKHRTFCEVIFWTGCRPCEALGLSPVLIDIDENTIIFRSAKKRGKLKNNHYRPVPVPHDFMKRLDRVHDIRIAKAERDYGASVRLWHFSRTTGWEKLRRVMQAANLHGAKACARGLRHTYGSHATLSGIPLPRVQCWLGHASLETTAIYLNLAEREDHTLAKRMW